MTGVVACLAYGAARGASEYLFLTEALLPPSHLHRLPPPTDPL